jgi:hypothetical protein
MAEFKNVQYTAKNKDSKHEIQVEFNPGILRKIFGKPGVIRCWVSDNLFIWRDSETGKEASYADQIIILRSLLTFKYASKNFNEKIIINDPND